MFKKIWRTLEKLCKKSSIPDYSLHLLKGGRRQAAGNKKKG
jgi:L-rhamnose mutarotase